MVYRKSYSKRKIATPIVIRSPDERRAWFYPRCASCDLPSPRAINARAIAGAIRRATIECAGLGALRGKTTLTRCANADTIARYNAMMGAH